MGLAMANSWPLAALLGRAGQVLVSSCCSSQGERTVPQHVRAGSHTLAGTDPGMVTKFQEETLLWNEA